MGQGGVNAALFSCGEYIGQVEDLRKKEKVWPFQDQHFYGT
jgi:hypothetical protein